MEDFIENFNIFRDWLYEYDKEINTTTEGVAVYIDIVNKFHELGLDEGF